jgi:hypothetical protein
MKIKAVSVLTSLLLVLSMTLAGTTAFADHRAVPNGRLASQIDYRYVADLGITDTEGRLLVWRATIAGDFTGEMKWWFEESPVADSVFDAGFVAFYAARWEIWTAGEGKLLLAGESAGKTVFPDGADGIWDGHGIVTEAKGKFKRLKGRKVYETGTVIWGTDPDPLLSGRGMFLIY